MSAYTKEEYLEKYARLITSANIHLRVNGVGSYLQFYKPKRGEKMPEDPPIEINISDSNTFNTQENGLFKGFSIDSAAEKLNVDEEVFKFMLQRMLTCHECGHALFTPPNVNSPIFDAAMKYIINFCEDARIECKVADLFPPVEGRIELMNRIFIAQNDEEFSKPVNMNAPMEVIRLSGLIACAYYYGMTDVVPKSKVARKMVEVMNELWSHPNHTIDDVKNYSMEIYKLIDKDDENLKTDCMAIATSWSENGGNGTANIKNYIEGEEFKNDIKKEENDINRTIKSYGMEIGAESKKQMATSKLIDYYLSNQIFQKLSRILGGKPSHHDVLDENGHSIDFDAYLDSRGSNIEHPKICLNAAKRDKADMHIAFCIDRSGSMCGSKVENAKKSAANLAFACENLDIKTAIYQFDANATKMKDFYQPLLESSVGCIESDGGTCISSGVKAAMNELSDVLDDNTRKAIIIISDGEDGSWDETANELNRDRRVKTYILGINADLTSFVKSLHSAGARVSGYSNIDSDGEIQSALMEFTTDFVRGCNMES